MQRSKSLGLLLFLSVPLSQSFSFQERRRGDTIRSRREVLASVATTTTTVAAPSLAAFFLLAGPKKAVNAIDLSGYSDGPRGLKYKITKEPTCQEGEDCPKPQRAQEVKALYTLYLGGFPEDGGKEIDSSKGLSGESPFKFLAGVGQVIPGWDLSILDMPLGEARRIVVPSELGYGAKGAGGGKIPGGATLYFDVQLYEIGNKSVLSEQQQKWLEEHPL